MTSKTTRQFLFSLMNMAMGVFFFFLLDKKSDSICLSY